MRKPRRTEDGDYPGFRSFYVMIVYIITLDIELTAIYLNCIIYDNYFQEQLPGIVLTSFVYGFRFFPESKNIHLYSRPDMLQRPLYV